MSLKSNTIRLLCALALLTIAACSSDDVEPSNAGSGAGTTSSGDTNASGQGGTQAGQGGTQAGTGGSGASGGDAGAGTGGSESDAGHNDGGAALEGCVVAQRIDECCPTWRAVTRAEAYADPCLVAIGEPPISGLEAQKCFPELCPDILCLNEPPLSRVAEPFGASGECTFVDECTATDACMIGVDTTQCCPCPASLPAKLIDREPCVTLLTQSFLPDGCQNPCPVDCAECPEVATPSCAVRNSASLCQ